MTTGTTNASSIRPAVCGLVEGLHARAAEAPGAVAVAGPDRVLTYRELAAQATTVARVLRAGGVAAEGRVGLFVEAAPELVVAVWGAVCSGGAYVPLSPEYPDERLRYMLDDSRPAVVLTQERLRDRLAALAPPDIQVVTLEQAETTEALDPCSARPRAADLAYVIYTSGSTGTPKGVMVEHGAVAAQLTWLHDEQRLGPGSAVLQKTPLSFDAAQWEVLAPATGATVVAGAPGLHRDPDLLVDTIVKHGVTTLQCVPTLLRALVEGGRLPECASLRRVYSGGETLTRALAEETLDTLPWIELINLYGPTECTINTSAHHVRRAELAGGPSAIPIGTPVQGTTYRVLDDRGVPLPVGEVGELHIGGVQLARGYLARPALTAERFVPDPFAAEPGARLYRTGDLARIDTDGAVHFVGRTDNQVKLRGFRVELDEIRLAIEAHEWVKTASVVVKPDPRTGFQNLMTCVELDPRRAALMDQGNHGAHHQSKASRLQVRAQLSNLGVRTDLKGTAIPLPGREPTALQRKEVFARKTYRHYDGGEVAAADILAVLTRRPAPAVMSEMDIDLLGELLRWFGQFRGGERLLPKYGYASPGALYATQLHVELNGIAGLEPGFYYYNPVDHTLVLVRKTAEARPFALHFIGKRAAIEPVYCNNIDEVLEIETGHMAGLAEEVLPRHGRALCALDHDPSIREILGSSDDDHHTGSLEVVPWTATSEAVDVYVQAHTVADLAPGQYALDNGALARVSDEVVLREQVIAINQQVYDRAQFGVTVVARAVEPRWRYVDLGRAMQRMSMNDRLLGFMSSGYSSESGNPLSSATRIDALLGRLGRPTGPSYFFLGGRVSETQRASEGMHEDTVHMRGPAEILRDDLVELLPDYMVPNKVVVFDALPVTANGKVDVRALLASDRTDTGPRDRPLIAPRTEAERRVAAVWAAVLRTGAVSVHDDFFAMGGNSLIAVTLVNRLNKEFAAAVPMQALFESPTVAELALRFGGEEIDASRLIPLHPGGQGEPVFCWPGLGGYPMNLRGLAAEAGGDRPVFGVQARGVNPGETAHTTIAEAAAEDVAEIRARQPHGPYTLWGYSFGARLAFEAAHQLEAAGEEVAELVLLVPGSPSAVIEGRRRSASAAEYTDPVYVAVLLSVFAGRIDHPHLDECLRVAHDDASFTAFVAERFDLDRALVGRIAAVVRASYEPVYTFRELRGRSLRAPVTVVKASGDDYSFLESAPGFADRPPRVVELAADHYSMLAGPGLAELVQAVRDRGQEAMVPHVNIKHFPVELPEQRQQELVAAVTAAVREAFGCAEDVISIALEPVDKDVWSDRVYQPEIVGRKDLLRKVPNY